MKNLSLFAGIGGFDLAAKHCGVTTMHAAEIDTAASSIFLRHFPDAELIKDVRNVTADHKADIVTAGWPCQGNSIAGRRSGMADDRSGLWCEVRRILEACRPQWFLGENVPGLLSVNRGRDFGIVLRDLANLGYGFAYRVLNAQFFGVPQRRRRVFIVGCFGNWRRAAEVLFESESLPWNSPKGQETSKVAAHATGISVAKCSGTITANKGNIRAEHAWTDQFVACTLPATDGGVSSGMHPIVYQCHGGSVGPMGTLRRGNGSVQSGVPFLSSAINDDGRGYDATKQHRIQAGHIQGVRRLTPLECERLQGFPDGWTEYGHDGKRMSDSARYRMIGNSVAVPCVEWIMRRIST